MASKTLCWCGSDSFSLFDEGYLSCHLCETLVSRRQPAVDITRARDDATDFYGRRYWFDHQRELGLPDIHVRCREDLEERCLHWLRAVLRYRTPGGQALELGCSHGGFVAYLQWAGFDASGLEISPWIVDFAQRTFGIPVLQGPLEDQGLRPASYDLVVALDVLEHLPDPLATLRLAASLLTPNGVLMIQTPCRPAALDLIALQESRHRFLEMLIPEEHLHLFTGEGLARLCGRAGLNEVRFEPAAFPHYDMFVMAGRQPLIQRGREEVRTQLEESPRGRQIWAMLRLHEKLEERTAEYLEADRDRIGRLEQIEELHRILEQKSPESESEKKG